MPRTRNAAPAAPDPEPDAQGATTNTASAVVTVDQPQGDPRTAAFRRVEQALVARSDALLAVLPGKVGVDRFMRVALGAMSRQPLLFDCTTESLVKAMLDAAELGLEPSGLMGQAYLVPFRNKVSRPSPTNPLVMVTVYQYEATLMIGYRGLVDLARRSGGVANVEARAVRQRDVFSIRYGTEPVIDHIPYLPGVMGAPLPGHPDAPADGAGPYVGFYAVITLSDGSKLHDYMTLAEVDAIRARSRAKDSGPWVTDYAEMGRKTVLRRDLKYAPSSVLDMRAAEALDAEDRAQFGPTTGGVVQGAIAQGANAAITAAAESFRQAASGQPTDAEFRPDDSGPDQPQAPQEAPGQAEAFQADQVDTQAPAAEPGGFTASPNVGVKVSGKATGKAGPARQADPPAEPVADPDTGEVRRQDADANTMVACEAANPYGDQDDVCLMPKGHAGPHRAQGKVTW